MLEVTVLSLQAIQAVMGDTYQTANRAVSEPRDVWDRHVSALWTKIQILTGAMLRADLEAGQLTEAQYDFAMDWLTNWMEYGPREAAAILDAWVGWVESSPAGASA